MLLLGQPLNLCSRLQSPTIRRWPATVRNGSSSSSSSSSSSISLSLSLRTAEDSRNVRSLRSSRNPRSPLVPHGSPARGGSCWSRIGAELAVGARGPEGVSARAAQGGGGGGSGGSDADEKRSGGGGLDDLDFAVFRFTLGIPWLDDRDIPRVVGTLLGVALLTNHMLTPQPQLPAQTVSECVGVLLIVVSLLLPLIDRKLQVSSGARLTTPSSSTSSASSPSLKPLFLLSDSLPPSHQPDMAWATYAALRNTSATALLHLPASLPLTLPPPPLPHPPPPPPPLHPNHPHCHPSPPFSHLLAPPLSHSDKHWTLHLHHHHHSTRRHSHRPYSSPPQHSLPSPPPSPHLDPDSLFPSPRPIKRAAAAPPTPPLPAAAATAAAVPLPLQLPHRCQGLSLFSQTLQMPSHLLTAAGLLLSLHACTPYSLQPPILHKFL
ncbi:unnamed protein product [Closterium sp. NIES-53]